MLDDAPQVERNEQEQHQQREHEGEELEREAMLSTHHAFDKDQEEKDALRKRIKAAKKLVARRFLERKAIYRDIPESYDENCINTKLMRQGDYDGATLVGEIGATLLMHLLQAATAAEYRQQQRYFSEAQESDRLKEERIAKGFAEEEESKGVRLAYQATLDPLTNKMVWPAVYPITNGQVDYTRKPNTDGKASRYAIEMNGFVPQEDYQVAFKNQFLRLSKDFSGSNSFTGSQRAMLHLFDEPQNKNKKRKRGEDNANSYQQATRRGIKV